MQRIKTKRNLYKKDKKEGKEIGNSEILTFLICKKPDIFYLQ